MKYRRAVVAGHFYPESAQQLRAQVGPYLIAPVKPEIRAHALIVPHAGYCYSGSVAGEAYAYLKSIASDIKRVILLGPSHRVALRGCAICDYDAFSSPLGAVKVNKEHDQELLLHNLVSVSEQAHISEHSLEVQLPFLQSCLIDFQIVPIVVGYCQAYRVSRILNTLKANNSSTLVVVSSDLSHYHPYQQARLLDEKTISQILNYDGTLQGDNACGCFAVNGLLDYAKSVQWKIRLINKANSGDILGDKREVVGYASFILY